MRILHVVGRSQRRGAETFALELARALDAHDHENSVVALTRAPGGDSDPDLPVLTEKLRVAPLVAGDAVRGLHRRLARDDVDVVLAHGGAPARAAAIVRGPDKPLLVWKRISPGAWRPVQRWWWRRIANRTDAVVALTAPLAHEMRDLGFGGPVWLIGNARSPERFVAIERREEALRLRREIGVEDDVALVGFVGNLVREKRPERTLDVITGVVGRGCRAHLVIVGDGPLRGRLETGIRDRHVGAHVSLLGHRSDVERLYGAFDVLVLTSDTEGVPGVAIEAQMAGCPVVTFPAGGVRQAVEHGVTGIVLARPDTSLMVDELIQILGSPDRRERLGGAGRQRAGALSTSRVAAEYSVRLTELHERHATPGREARAQAGSAKSSKPRSS